LPQRGGGFCSGCLFQPEQKTTFSVTFLPAGRQVRLCGEQRICFEKNVLTSIRCDLIAAFRDFAFHNRCGKAVD
jgi:hypothetical protein